MSLPLKPVTGSEKLNRTVKGPDTGGSAPLVISTVSGVTVIPEPESDQAPVPSALVARTCTWWDVFSDRLPISVAVVRRARRGRDRPSSSPLVRPSAGTARRSR